MKGKWVNEKDNTPKRLLSKNEALEGVRPIFLDEC